MANRKLPADDRIEEIVDAAERSIIRDRALAFGMNEIAAEIGTSRALIYVYFDGPGAIVDEVCWRHLNYLAKATEGWRDRGGTLPARAVALGRAYFAYLVQRGLVLGYILRERNGDSPLRKSVPLFRAMLREIVREFRSGLQFEPREALVFVELLSAIPESLARAVKTGELPLAVAEETIERLVGDLVADMQVRN